MRVLVTGGAGFIGSHTADALLAEGHDVRVLDSLEEPVHPGGRVPSYLDERIEFRRGDVRDEATLLDAMRGCEVIFHFAAFQDYLPYFSRFFDVNVTSTARVFELIVREKLGVEKVIVASSQSTLGEGLYLDAGGRPVLPDCRPDAQLAAGRFEIEPPPGYRGPLSRQRTGEDVANPQNPYGLSKIAEEKVALHLGKSYGIPSVAMRYSIVQGPRQSFYNAYSGACRVFCLSFHQGVEPTIYEDGLQVRDYVNIEDVVAANLLVMKDERANYQRLNVGGDCEVTVNEFAKVVASAFGREDYEPRASGLYRFGDTRHIRSDVGRLRELGWEPRRDIAHSVECYKAWLDSSEVSGREVLDYCNRQMAKLNVVREVGS